MACLFGDEWEFSAVKLMSKLTISLLMWGWMLFFWFFIRKVLDSHVSFAIMELINQIMWVFCHLVIPLEGSYIFTSLDSLPFISNHNSSALREGARFILFPHA